MWVDKVVLEIGQYLVCVAFDDDSTAQNFRSQVEMHVVDDVLDRVDYSIQIDTTAPGSTTKGQPAALRGRRVILRSTTIQRLIMALRFELVRVCNAEQGGLRLDTAVLERQGLGLLVPSKISATLSDRALGRKGMEAIDCLQVRIDPTTGHTFRGKALGESHEPEPVQVVAWWLGESVFGHDDSTAARRIAAALSQVIDPESHNPHELLESMRLIESLVNIRCAPEGPAEQIRAADRLLLR